MKMTSSGQISKVNSTDTCADVAANKANSRTTDMFKHNMPKVTAVAGVQLLLLLVASCLYAPSTFASPGDAPSRQVLDMLPGEYVSTCIIGRTMAYQYTYVLDSSGKFTSKTTTFSDAGCTKPSNQPPTTKEGVFKVGSEMDTDYRPNEYYPLKGLTAYRFQFCYSKGGCSNQCMSFHQNNAFQSLVILLGQPETRFVEGSTVPDCIFNKNPMILGRK